METENHSTSLRLRKVKIDSCSMRNNIKERYAI